MKSKIISHFIIRKIYLNPVETILIIPRELEYLRGLMKINKVENRWSIVIQSSCNSYINYAQYKDDQYKSNLHQDHCEAIFCPSIPSSMRWLYLKVHTLPVKEKKNTSVFLNVKSICSWNQITYFLWMIYNLELIDISSKIKHQILEFYVKLPPLQTKF
jgi:hypothetical protein